MYINLLLKYYLKQKRACQKKRKIKNVFSKYFESKWLFILNKKKKKINKTKNIKLKKLAKIIGDY